MSILNCSWFTQSPLVYCFPTVWMHTHESIALYLQSCLMQFFLSGFNWIITFFWFYVFLTFREWLRKILYQNRILCDVLFLQMNYNSVYFCIRSNYSNWTRFLYATDGIMERANFFEFVGQSMSWVCQFNDLKRTHAKLRRKYDKYITK